MAHKAVFGREGRLDQDDLDIADEATQIDFVIMPKPGTKILGLGRRSAVASLKQRWRHAVKGASRLPKRIVLGLRICLGQAQPQQVLDDVTPRYLTA